MELIKTVSRRTRIGELTYDILNVSYALLLLVLVINFDPPVLAFALVLLSKWRVFAVRPRFWWANVQSNLVDAIVGFSTVGLLWLTMEQLAVQIFITALFAAWLVVLKPRSKKRWVLLQAGIGQFVGLTALFSIAHIVPDVVIVALTGLVAFATARHALTAFKSESDRTLLSMVWAFVLGELAWLSYHWVIAYSVGPQLLIPQIAIVAGVIGFMAMTLYSAFENDGKIEFAELRWPFIFSGLIIILLLVRFSGLDVSQL